MTRSERRRLAKAARELAMECVTGTAPAFGTGVEFHHDGTPACVLGHALLRAGFRPEPGRLYVFSETVNLPGPQNLVTHANDWERGALPWALLNLADELETQR